MSLASTAAALAFSCNFYFLKSSQKNFNGHAAYFSLFLSTDTTYCQMCIAATAAAPEFAFQPGFTICFCLQCDKLGFGLFSSHCNVAATAFRFQKTVSSTVNIVSFEFMKQGSNVV
jgi:hypothetical protein